MPDHNITICYTTCPDLKLAETISLTLIESGLAACCNILNPIQSIYKWEGQIHHETEFVLIIKTISANSEAVKELILKLHSYECPMILSISAQSLNEAYTTWLLQACQTQDS